ncbi:MAG: hypothetical protein C3F06_05845 [Candidatus Methanoperedenaceae archaeon]|nr:MAG: hypothetical protein C3F06_05845 [Candidatus Methanoperedenaceae archaeon]
MKIILLVILVSIMFVEIAAAVEQDPKILYNGIDNINPINVSVDPNPISPPISVEYNGWNNTTKCGFSGDLPCSTYNITITNDVTNAQVCSESGNITSDPFYVMLPNCRIPSTSAGVSHTILAIGECPRGGCENKNRSRHIGVDAEIYPTPELSTIVLISAGIFGLLLISGRYQK